jgi:putative colanic acid biosynthesis glycosyltransferase
MKLLQINSTVNYGSTGRIAEDLGKYVIKNGGESVIAYGRYNNESASSLVKIGSSKDQFVHLLGTRLFDTHGFHSKNATKKLIKQIEKINPDLIHLHNIHGYYLNIEALFSFLKKINKPVIWTLHDCWAFTGHCCHYERVGCDKWKTACHTCPLQFLYPESKWIDNSTQNFINKKDIFNGVENLTIVAVSKWLGSQVQQSFLKEYPLERIYNGIDQTIFKPKDRILLKEKFGYTDQQIILGVANEWSEGKGLGMFIEMSTLLKSDLVILLVGLNANQIKTLPHNIIGINRTENQNELADYYAMADVFVTPSVAETFGLVVAEALSCGTPCVVNNASALPELIDDKVGKVVKHNAESYVKAIYELLSIPKQEYAQTTLEKAKQFSIERHLKSYYDLYQQKIEI